MQIDKGVDTLASKMLFTNYSGKLSFSQLSPVLLPPDPKLFPWLSEDRIIPNATSD